MDVTDLWTEIVLWLRHHAPTTAAALHPPTPEPDLDFLEKEFRVELPEELRQWWACCGGTEDDTLADVLPPFYTPYGAAHAWKAWKVHREAGDWDLPNREYYAGSAATSFHPAWIPIAGDGFADELVVDLRPGPLRGCVLEWEQEAGRVQRPEWRGVRAMLADVHRALTEGVPAGHSHPTVTEDGRLDWQIS